MRGRWQPAGIAVGLVVAAGTACQYGDPVTRPALAAACEALPASGTAPLAVSFRLSVSGAEGPVTVAVSYGDGTSGTDPGAAHTYAAGVFAASFAVTTATQSARCTTTVTVQPGTTPASPPAAGNQPPTAVFKTSPDAVRSRITGAAPLRVIFNMCASTDPENDRILFQLDFDGDGSLDKSGSTGLHCRHDHTYDAGSSTPRFCVRDVDEDGRALHADQCRTYTVVAAP